MKCHIIQAPNPALRVKADPITETKLIWQVAQDLRDTFEETENCIGLAATQIGYFHRIIIVDVSARRTETYVMVNPIIVKVGKDLQAVNDGCMSINYGKSHAMTKRPKLLTVEWQDENGMTRKQKFSGLLATAIHHEIDHLDGILYTDRLAAAIAKGVLK